MPPSEQAYWVLVDSSADDEGHGLSVIGLYTRAQTALTELQRDVIGPEQYTALWWYPAQEPSGRTYQYLAWDPRAGATAFTLERVEVTHAAE